jgi:phage major head subunit gpT-like protein
MANLDNALQQLREERSRTQLVVGKLDLAISAIESLNGTGASRKATRPTRIVSAVSRRKMARAQRARWARVKAHNVIPIASRRGKRTISAAGRRRIAPAARARWAKFRAAKKTA